MRKCLAPQKMTFSSFSKRFLIHAGISIEICDRRRADYRGNGPLAVCGKLYVCLLLAYWGSCSLFYQLSSQRSSQGKRFNTWRAFGAVLLYLSWPSLAPIIRERHHKLLKCVLCCKSDFTLLNYKQCIKIHIVLVWRFNFITFGCILYADCNALHFALWQGQSAIIFCMFWGWFCGRMAWNSSVYRFGMACLPMHQKHWTRLWEMRFLSISRLPLTFYISWSQCCHHLNWRPEEYRYLGLCTKKEVL